jgi:hypothetical protein
MTVEPNYWVDQSIVGDGTWIVGSTRDGGVVESAATREEAEAICADLNTQDEVESGIA